MNSSNPPSPIHHWIGQSQKMHLSLSRYNIDQQKFSVAPGKFLIEVCASSQDIRLRGQIEVR